MNNPSDQRRNIVANHGALTVVGLPAFDDNLIWVIQPLNPTDSGLCKVCVVDPGDAAPVIDYCRRQQLVPSDILLTHHHADHTGGVAQIREWIQQKHPDCDLRVYGPAVEAIPTVTHPLSGGEVISLFEGIQTQVLSVAGHTRGHLAYWLPDETGCIPAALFSGDLLFGLGCGRLFEGTAEQMYAALTQVARLDPDTKIYCAHEYTALNLPFALKVDPENGELLQRAARIRALRQAGEPTLPLLLAEELATNPFLRCEQPALVAAACVGEGIDACDTFAALRKMRDTFKGV